ncbi:MAG: hypothetical protein R3F48_06495 [Candidatus Zixiibacteriota bacterium]
MKKTTTLFILLVLTFAAAMGSFISAGDISISAEVTQASIAFEAKDTLIVRLSWEGEPFLYQIDGVPMPVLDKFEVLGSSSAVSAGTDSSGKKMTGRTFTYVLQPVDYGTGIINELSLNAVNKVTEESHLLQTGRITVEIAKPVPREEVASSDNTVMFIIMFGFLLIFVGGGIVYLKKRKQPEPEAKGNEKYLNDLELIKRETVADGKLFFSRLYRLLHSYLENEQSLALSGKTGEEVISEVQTIENDEIKATFISWLERLHREKYRPDAPKSSEVDELYRAVKTFFEKSSV